MFSNTERAKFNYKERVKRVLLLQAKANAARLQLKLKMLKEKRYCRKRKKITATKELKRLKDATKMLKDPLLIKPVTRIANLKFLDLELLANLGQLQANFNFFINLSFLNALLLLSLQGFKFRGSFSKILLLGTKLSILLGA